MKVKYILILILLPVIGFAQIDTNKVSKQKLVDSVLVLNKKLERYEKDFDRIVAIEKKDLGTTVKEFIAEVKLQNLSVTMLGGAFAGVTFISLIVSIFLFFRRLNTEVGKEVDKQITLQVDNLRKKFRKELEQVADQEVDNLERAIRENGIVSRIERIRKILVICKDRNDKIYIEDFFRNLGFEHLDIEILDKYISVEKYDLVVFDNHSLKKRPPKNIYEEMSDEKKRQLDPFYEEADIRLNLMNQFLKNVDTNNKTLYIHFGPMRVNFPDVSEDQAAFANTRHTLYPRILEMLTFAEKKQLNSGSI